jgi:hypothetical protein
MRKNKSVFERNSVFYKIGKFFEDVNPLVSYNIKNYGVQNIYKAFHEDKTSVTEKEKKEFAMFISDLKSSREKLENKTELTKEDYANFLIELFNNLDKTDREGEVTLKTAGSFRILYDLIDILSIFGSIDPDWVKKSNFFLYFLEKYCKFKYIDLTKALNSGQQPKRGNPNEAKLEEEINKEFNQLVKEEKTVKDEENIENDKNLINSSEKKTENKEDFSTEEPQKKSVMNPNLFIRRGGENPTVKDRINFYSSNKNNNYELKKKENGNKNESSIENQLIIDDSERKCSEINANLTPNFQENEEKSCPADDLYLDQFKEDINNKNNSNKKKILSSPNIHSILDQNLMMNKDISIQFNCNSNINQEKSKTNLECEGDNKQNQSEDNEIRKRKSDSYNLLHEDANDNSGNTRINNQISQLNNDNEFLQKDSSKNDVTNQNTSKNLQRDLINSFQNKEEGFNIFHKIDPELYKINLPKNVQTSKPQETIQQDPRLLFNFHPNFTTLPQVSDMIFKHIKPYEYKLPVNKNSKEYQVLIERVLQHIELGSSELDYKKIPYSINHIEMALYYMRNINNNSLN